MKHNSPIIVNAFLTLLSLASEGETDCNCYREMLAFYKITIFALDYRFGYL